MLSLFRRFHLFRIALEKRTPPGTLDILALSTGGSGQPRGRPSENTFWTGGLQSVDLPLKSDRYKPILAPGRPGALLGVPLEGHP